MVSYTALYQAWLLQTFPPVPNFLNHFYWHFLYSNAALFSFQTSLKYNLAGRLKCLNFQSVRIIHTHLSFTVPHKQKCCKIQTSWSCKPVSDFIRTLKTLSSASTELFVVGTFAISSISCPYMIILSDDWSRVTESISVTFGIFFMKKHRPSFYVLNCVLNPNF
jgi:hypothetical protein